ncbi:MAG TPA: sensor histidine kinase [Pseudonocardiaceae bacterium]
MLDSAGADPAAWPPRRRLRGWTVVALDTLTVTALAVLAVYATVGTGIGFSDPAAAGGWLIALAITVPLAFRRRWPLPVLGVVLASAMLGTVLGMPGAATVPAVAIALYPVAVSVTLRRSVIAVTAAALGVAAATVPAVLVPALHLVAAPDADVLEADLLSTLGFCWVSIGAGWALGRAVRARRQHALQIAEHRAQQAVADERLRIAREMHDVVAHSMGVIVMKAAVANHVYPTRPEEGREALGVIESVGRGALTDMSRVLGALRSAGKADLAPSPGLDAVPTLVENARLAGVDVELHCRDLPTLPTAVQLSAYRIVQEALTNVIKHAAPARCTVRIAADSGELCLDVIDDGAASRQVDEPGHGLIGMRERAALHEGTLVAGRRRDGGFAVQARLPYRAPGRHD